MVNGFPAIAAIDLGSNSFRLLIGQASASAGCPVTLTRRRAPVSLARSRNCSGELAPETMAEGLESLREFRRVMTKFAVSRCRCCGTAALRQANNRLTFLEEAASILETGVEVLSTEEEAELGCRGVLAGLAESLVFPCLIADVGGGSTELTHIDSGQSLIATTSLPFGAVTLSTKGLTEQMHLRSIIRSALGKITPHGLPAPVPTLVATGGTASILAALAQGLEHYAPGLTQGFKLAGANFPILTGRLGRWRAGDQSLPEMARGREDILMAGLEIYEEIIATIGGEGMIVSDAGLLEGILLSLLETA